MRVALVAVFACLLGCGRLDFERRDADVRDADSIDAGAIDAAALDAGALDAGALDAGAGDAGAIDGGAPDGGCVWGEFGMVTHLDAVDTADGEGGGTLSADRLRLYFNRAPGPGQHDLYLSERADVALPFGAGVKITELSTDLYNEAEAAIRDDELAIFFHSNRPTGTSVYVAERASRTAMFGEVRCAIVGCAPFLGPTVSPDAASLYGFTTGALGSRAIFAASRSLLGTEFEAPVELDALSVAGADDSYPGVSHDGLELYWAREGGPGSLGCDDLWVATRADTASPFGSPHAVEELNTASCESDPSLSADGATLVFTSDRPGTRGREDLWLAQRECIR